MTRRQHVGRAPRAVRWPLPIVAVAIVILALLHSSQALAPRLTIRAHAPFEIVAQHLHEPAGLAWDPKTGDLFVAEAEAGVILRIEPTGRVHTHAVGFRRPHGIARDPRDGSLLVVDEEAGSLNRLSPTSAVTKLRTDLERPRWVAVAPDGTIVLSAEEGGGFHIKGNQRGILLRLAPDGSSPQLLAVGLKRPQGLRVLPDGRIQFLADRHQGYHEREGGALFELAPGGEPSLLVRKGFKEPHDLSADQLAATYFTAEGYAAEEEDEEDAERGIIGKPFTAEVVVPFAWGLREPQGLAFDDQGNLYVAEADAGRILKFLAPLPPTLDPRPPAFTRNAAIALTGTAGPNAVITVRGTKPALPPQQDVSAQITPQLAPVILNPATQTYDQTVALTNNGATPLAGPLAFVVTAITAADVTLANATTTVNGHPAIQIPLPGSLLRSGDRTSTVLQFHNPRQLDFTFSQQVWTLRPLAIAGIEGHFTVPVILAPNTENHLEVHATGALGLGLTSAPAKATVTHDDIPPILALTDPISGTFVPTTSVTVRGNVQDVNLDRVTVNGVDATLAGTTIQATVPLTEGSNAITATASDKAGNTGTATVTIIRDTTPPSIAITSPVDNQVITQPTTTVQGTVNDVNLAQVIVNGVTATLTENSYQAAVSLTEGSNRLTATAVDKAGNTASQSVTVTRATRPTVTGTTPGRAQFGAQVIIVGENFFNVQSVAFNGVAAAFTVLNATAITALVPVGATSGPITVVTPGGTATSSSFFTVLVPPSLAITSPSDGATINADRVIVKGTVGSAAGESGVLVNGGVAQVNNGQWAIALPLAEGGNPITVTATDPFGTTSTARITVQVPQVTEPPLLLTVTPSSGVASLAVRFTAANQTGRPLVRFELDADGDGTADVTATSFEDVPVTFPNSGTFFPVLKATDDQGTTYRATTVVTVRDPAALDASLKSRWTGLKAALTAGDATAALAHIVQGVRESYAILFAALGPSLSALGADMPPIEPVYFEGAYAKYRLRRTQVVGGTAMTITHYIYFCVDEDGLWRIESF